MTDVVKKGLGILVLAFIVYYLVTQPEGAADAVRGAFDAVIEAFHSIIKFFHALVSG